MRAAKAESARQKLAEAEKSLARKRFFKSSPDWETAERQLKAAAQDFKLARECGDRNLSEERFRDGREGKRSEWSGIY